MSTATETSSQASATSPSPLHPNVVVFPRPSQTRGGDNHGWLKTFHTFSFAMYQDSQFESWGHLRVLNEDRVDPGTGFGTHSHREFEIFSYVVSGELEHKDSMGNTEILKRGDLQLTSAGTGIKHSEKAHGPQQVHFLQIWTLPSKARLEPKYFTRHFTDEEKKDKWARVVAPVESEGVVAEREASGPAPVQSPVSLYATLLSPSSTITHTFSSPSEGNAQRRGYVHVVQTSGYNTGKAAGATVQLNGGLMLAEGDGAFALAGEGEKIEVKNVGDRVAEVLLFDVV
ncbi:pirin domain-containing protein [Gautieria morchelliformis]|nr:pirin domain-containing protein [Gautieria morchelliformis]